jgi:hypothetical protein
MTFLSRLFCPIRASRAELDMVLTAKLAALQGHHALVAEHAALTAKLAALQASDVWLPFVCVLAEGVGPHGPVTLGASGRARKSGTVIELSTMTPLVDVRMTVFCDLERVDVHGIFLGSDLVTAALGSCPSVRFPQWHPGVRVLVQCTLSQVVRP